MNMKTDWLQSVIGSMNKKETAVRLTVLVVLCVMPTIFRGNNGILNLLVMCLFYASFGISWNIIAGYGGQTSYCHCAFISIGAYVGAIFFKKFGISPWVTMPLGVILSVGFATFMGKACFRYRGPFFGITTIAFSELLRIMLLILDDITYGARGIMITSNVQSFWKLKFDTDIPFYFIALVMMVGCMVGSALFLQSKNGYYLRTIRADEDAAMSLGIDTNKVKLRAFQLSAAMVSIIGMVYAFFTTYIEPQTLCGTDMMIKVAAIGYLGGNNRLGGPVLGAFIMLPLIYYCTMFFGAAKATNFFYGIALVLVILLAPNGLIPILERAFKNVGAKLFHTSKPEVIE